LFFGMGQGQGDKGQGDKGQGQIGKGKARVPALVCHNKTPPAVNREGLDFPPAGGDKAERIQQP
jgi:hypothetical protein